VTNGIAPLEVQFSSAGSRDPDPQDSLTFAWDFDGNGTTDSTDPNAAHVYTQNGVYAAKLTVTDSSGKTDVKTTTITVGNTAPTVRVVTPLAGDFFAFGDALDYVVEVEDPEDSSIDCSRVQVTAVLVHDEHGHGGDSQIGCTGTLATDAADASHGGYIGTGVSATYTDEGANGQPPLSTTTQNVVQVRRQQVEYTQEQSGTATGNSGEPDVGGGQVRNSLDDGDYVAINRFVNLTNMNKEISFRFAANATAGTNRANVEIHLDSPTGPLATTVTLQATGGNNTFTTQTFPLNFTGSRRVYLVFKTTSGGAAGNFGNLNWVEFSGAGTQAP
jgi:PKD repeat protein